MGCEGTMKRTFLPVCSTMKEDENMYELAALKEVLENEYPIGYLEVKHVLRAESFSRDPISVKKSGEVSVMY